MTDDERYNTDYCGCCGREIHPGSASSLWCPECLGHVGQYGPLWERTWFALTGDDCPWQVPA